MAADRGLVESVTLAWRNTHLGISILFHTHCDAVACLTVHVVRHYILALPDGLSHIFSPIKIYIILLGLRWSQMTPNGVILVTVNPTKIAILSFMHGAKISIRVSIWSFEQEIIRPHTSLFIVVAIDVLLHWNWHEALSNIMIIPFG